LGVIATVTVTGHPDLLFYSPNFKKYKEQYMPALQEAIAKGLKNGRMAQNNKSIKYIKNFATEFFNLHISESNIKTTSSYDKNDLLEREEKFVGYAIKTYGSFGMPSYKQTEVGGGYKFAPGTSSSVKKIMDELNKK
jgi:uncharacterized protein Veg